MNKIYKKILPYLFLSLPIIFTFSLDQIIKYQPNDHSIKNLNYFDTNQNKNLYSSKLSFFDQSDKYLQSEIKTKLISLYKENKDNNIISGELKKINLNKNYFEEINFSKNTAINDKKNKFIKVVLPLIIKENSKILSDRLRLLEAKDYLVSNKTLSKQDQKFIEDLSVQYFIQTENKHKIDTINELLLSVDVIPNSIVLAQAANESGWGTSRFATKFNALFGQYTYDHNMGIKPNKSKKTDKHLIRHFPSINQSVQSYFKNINTHFAYKEFRILRSKIKDKNNEINIYKLVNKLNVYAEDKNYVATLISIINGNKLNQFDKFEYQLTNS